MPDHTLDRGEAQPQPTLEIVDAIVDLGHAQDWIDVGVEIDDLAVRRFADPYLMHIAHHAEPLRDARKLAVNCADALIRGVDVSKDSATMAEVVR